MPKLALPLLQQRIANRIEELESGKAVAARDVRLLLTEEQIKQLDDAWKQQLLIRKNYKLRTAAQKLEHGYKTKRELTIEAFKQAYAKIDDDLLDYYEKRQREVEVRGARIFLDAYFKAKDEGKEPLPAACNAMKRAGLQPPFSLTKPRLNKRDAELKKMEEYILNRK